MPYAWRGYYPNGMGADRIVLPVGRWVEITLRATQLNTWSASRQRLHLPELGWTVALDAGTPVVRWVRARRAFQTSSVCVESCDEHAERFVVTVEAREPEAYQAWVDRLLLPPDGLSLSRWGAQLAASQGCPACHGAFASSLDETWGQTRELPDGTSLVVRGEAGRQYVRNVIRSPAEFAGASGVTMPSYATLHPVHLEAIVEYVRCRGLATCPPEPPEPSEPSEPSEPTLGVGPAPEGEAVAP